MKRAWAWLCCASFVVSSVFGAWAQRPAEVKPARATQPVSDDPDDPAVWIHPSDPSKSLVIGTDKTAAPKGGLYVFDLKGNIRQHIFPIDRPNNVDVEYALSAGSERIDIAVVTERLQRKLRIFSISPKDGKLTDISGKTAVFEGLGGEKGAPMGIALYRRPKDGAIFAIVSAKESNPTDCLYQYRIVFNTASKKADLRLVRKFGKFSGKKEIEALCVDDELGYLYAADEGAGIRKYSADPDRPGAGKELAFFATSGWKGDHEGIAVYSMPGGKGYLIATDQIPGGSIFRIYRREGEPGKPHDHRLLKEVAGGSDETDGIEAVSANLGPSFPSGLFVAMNSGPKNFLLYDWRAIAESGSPKLEVRKGSKGRP